MTMRRAIVRRAIASAVVLLGAASAGADSINLCFTRITDNADVDIAEQLELIVYESAGEVTFEFYNNGPNPGIITDIYWDDRNGLFESGFVSLADDWGTPASPENLSGGNALTPSFESTHSTDSDPPPSHTGIDVNESAAFVLQLTAGTTFADVQEDFANEDLRVAVHVQGLDDDNQKSDTFLAIPKDDPDTPEIPEPSTIMLLGLGLAGLGLATHRHRRRRRAA